MAQILVVDDSSTVRNEVSNFLQSNGLTVSEAIDGVDGLKKISLDNELKLVICDVNMPNMDGLTMAEKVRSEAKKQQLPIIMLTTESNPSLKSRGKAAGVKGWIVKPFNGASALAGIKKLIGG